jgi:hypothetical protein
MYGINNTPKGNFFSVLRGSHWQPVTADYVMHMVGADWYHLIVDNGVRQTGIALPMNSKPQFVFSTRKS